MKRFLLSALVALGVVSASAQSYLVDNPANRAYFGIRVGGEVTCPGKITGGPVGIKFFNNGGGVEFGGIYNIPVVANFYVEPGLKLYYNTYSVKKDWVDLFQDDIVLDGVSVRKFGIRVPVMAGYHFDFTRDVRLHLFTGPELEVGFSGKELVKGEPDASSFPSGGLRATFEARGYTAWDPTSPAFIKDRTLYIPTAFCSYSGEALDKKTPLLRSMEALNNEAVKMLKLLGNETATRVSTTIGPEQEYFLVDESLYNARPDLVLCNRTVIGHTSAKDQQLEDHYFGAIPSKVSAFMKDFETEAYKLGILLQTRHNEVAPNQFECAPLFCEATNAIDQNMMLMIVMQKIAEKHHLKVIFHEKPFDGVNGSGKHCNWSMMTNTGVNLLSPGKTPTKNLQFLSFFSAVVNAVYKHHYLLMAGISNLSNSYRLGGNEAPPAVMSVFAGSTLSNIFEAIGNMQALKEENNLESIKIVNSLPEIFPDNTDRNRTSPFAFTGNRFEFRAVGSSINVASAIYILNSVVAESLNRFRAEVDALVAAGEDKSQAMIGVQMASAYMGSCLAPPLFGLLANHITAELLPLYLCVFLVFMLIMHEITQRKAKYNQILSKTERKTKD